jgi:hypothetical protein
VVIGTSFAWLDLLSYTLGAALVVLCERMVARRRVSVHADGTTR